MENNQCCQNKAPKWYNSYDFPLVPFFKVYPPGKYSSKDLVFKWLFFKIWTSAYFCFEIAFMVNTEYGIGFTGKLPYLNWIAVIPCPERMGAWIDSKLIRRPKQN